MIVYPDVLNNWVLKLIDLYLHFTSLLCVEGTEWLSIC